MVFTEKELRNFMSDIWHDSGEIYNPVMLFDYIDKVIDIHKKDKL
jgi:hypothetical protein